MSALSLKRKINVKFQSLDKTKRVRDVPENFDALKKQVEALIRDDKIKETNISQNKERDYVIKYEDKEHEMINVSDDEDLFTAYEVAELELNGNLKFVIEPKQKKTGTTLANETKESKPISKAKKSKKDKEKLKKVKKNQTNKEESKKVSTDN